MSRRQSPTEKAKAKETSSPSNVTDDQKRYCICQKREDELNDQDSNDFMVECDGCNGWFHSSCIGLADRIADDLEKYFCSECSNQHGPSIVKQRRNQHRRDFSDANADNKPMQSGTRDFINALKRRVLPSCESVITRLKGHQLTTEYLAEMGFTRPILIANRDGLDITLPSRTITLAEVNELAGHDRSVDIIDCEKQVTYKMTLEEYIEYFESFERNKIYNVLSLEISDTKLGEHVVTPRIVRELSWATIGVWPAKKTDAEPDSADIKSERTMWSSQAPSKKKRRAVSASDNDPSDDDEQFEDVKANHFENFERPEVAKYCLISPQSSYTDFHVDFGGSSVWYSVVRGEKIFYLIEPTDENLQIYADWSRSPTESETFLGDSVKHCYRMHLREDNTVFIPAGWIHAVYTVTDSLVFGGNFLHSMGVDMQLRIYELERLAQVPNKFQFPLFETFHWYAAKSFYEELKAGNESNSSTIDPITQHACESILHYMSKWLSMDKRRKSNDSRLALSSASSELFVPYQIRNRPIVPTGINCEKILRDLGRELDQARVRCGSASLSKPLSSSIVASPMKVLVPLDHERDLVHFNDKKIKVKCRRLSSTSEWNTQNPTSGKAKTALAAGGMKLTIKTSLSGCRKPSNARESSPIVNKKKAGRAASSMKQQKNSNANEIITPKAESPKMTYTLDLEAKRLRFIEPPIAPSHNHDTDSDDQLSSSDTNHSSMPGNVNADTNDSQDNTESIDGLADGGLASFVKRSSIHDDFYHSNKANKIKREHSSADAKTSSAKKSKASTEAKKSIKSTKKVKTEDSASSTPHGKKSVSSLPSKSSPSLNASTSSSSGLAKKRPSSSSASPKKPKSKDRLGKILKIANSIKSRGGILT